MNLSTLANFYAVLRICILSAFLTACETAGEIGSSLIPRGSVEVIASDSFTIDASTVLVDPVNTTTPRALLVGQYNDPIFGRVKASTFMEIGPSFDEIFTDVENVTGIPDTVTRIDSIQFTLAYLSAYGATNVTQRINVHRLTDSLTTGFEYTNEDIIPFDPVPLATMEVSADELEEDGFLVFTLRYDESDFVKEISDLVTADERPTGEEFQEVFKGITFTTENTDAAVLRFNAGAAGGFPAIMRLYFENDGALDNVPLIFSIFPFFNRVESDRQGSSIDFIQAVEQPVPASQTDNFTYIQSGVGIFTRIEFPTIQDLKNLGTIGINEAILTIRPSFGSGDDFDPPPFLILLQTDESNNILEIVNSIGASTPIPGTPFPFVFEYNFRFEEYRADVTSYVQALLNEDTDGDALLIATPGEDIDSILTINRIPTVGQGVSTSANRLIININNSNEPFPTRLEVTYTRFE